MPPETKPDSVDDRVTAAKTDWVARLVVVVTLAVVAAIIAYVLPGGAEGTVEGEEAGTWHIWGGVGAFVVIFIAMVRAYPMLMGGLAIIFAVGLLAGIRDSPASASAADGSGVGSSVSVVLAAVFLFLLAIAAFALDKWHFSTTRRRRGAPTH